MLKRILSLFSRPPKARTPAPEQPQREIRNPELLHVLDKLAASYTPDHQDEFTASLNAATYLAIIQPDTEPPPRTPAGTLRLIFATDANGNRYLPLFTDKESIRTYTNQPGQHIILPAIDAWTLATRTDHYHGVVINPGSNNLPLLRRQLDFLLRTSKEESRLSFTATASETVH